MAQDWLDSEVAAIQEGLVVSIEVAVADLAEQSGFEEDPAIQDFVALEVGSIEVESEVQAVEVDFEGSSGN